MNWQIAGEQVAEGRYLDAEERHVRLVPPRPVVTAYHRHGSAGLSLSYANTGGSLSRLAWRRRTLLSDAMWAATPSGWLVHRTNRTFARLHHRRRSRRAVRGRRRRRRRIARRALRRRPAETSPSLMTCARWACPSGRSSTTAARNGGVLPAAWGPPAGSAVAATGRTSVAGVGPGAAGPSARGLTTGNRHSR